MVPLHLGNDVAPQAQLPAEGLELLRRALPPVAKVVVVAHHQMDGSMLPHQIIGDELPPGQLHHAPVKVGDDNLPNAVIAHH